MDRKIRVLVASTHPIQYHYHLWRQLSSNELFDILVLYGTSGGLSGYQDREFMQDIQWDEDISTQFVYRILNHSKKPPSLLYPRARWADLRCLFKKFQPDIVILNAYSRAFWYDVFTYATKNKVKCLLRTEATDTAVKRGFLKSLIRDALLRLFYDRIAGFCAIGTNAEKHFSRLGIPKEKITWSPYSIDSEKLGKNLSANCHERNDLRLSMGIKPEDRVLLFSGKLVSRKDPFLILGALADLEQQVLRKTHLIIAGDGELKEEFDCRALELLGARYHAMGFLNQEELWRPYLISDFLILPSKEGFHETWGLVVNEGMQAGCIPIVSSAVGCAIDLVREDTGRCFQAGSMAGLRAALQELLTLPQAKLSSMQARSKNVILDFSTASSVKGLELAILRAFKG